MKSIEEKYQEYCTKIKGKLAFPKLHFIGKDIFYSWQSAFADAPSPPDIIHDYLYENLKMYRRNEPSELRKYYNSSDVAMKDLLQAIDFYFN